jgi:serine/threonine-protein kinase SRPK3
LEDAEKRLYGEEKALFLNFVRKMLKWKPEERSSAKELLDDLWLNRV